jgi:hypothetical protein
LTVFQEQVLNLIGIPFLITNGYSENGQYTKNIETIYIWDRNTLSKKQQHRPMG